MPIVHPPLWRKARVAVSLSIAALALAGCGEKPKPAAGGMKVPVSVITVQPQHTAIYTELPGRVEAIKDAEIRARVNGIVTKVAFTQGGDVKEGDLLFIIDPAPYKAARDQAAAQLKKAQADARSAQLLAQRYANLIKVNAVSRQDYDNAVAQAGQAAATVAAAKASLESADIDLGYTRVVSPITGRIGKSLVTEGALVSASGATQLATVQELDRVYVDFSQSTTDLSRLRRALASGELEQTSSGKAKAEVVLEDGTLYDHSGELLFSGVTVDPNTGQVNLRAVFPNPDKILLPGMYVQARIEEGVDQKALLVPQQALQRTAEGLSALYVVKDGKAAQVMVQVGPEVKGKSVIYKGLQPGDQVMVEGFQKVRPGAPVQPKPWTQPKPQGAAAAAAPAGADKAPGAAGDKPAATQSSAKG
ncbi:efflux RND transporter periplasmic adaptor subunit [Candidimonas humi]|nr:efflux RND transporter periplasmic adaptor subunit [Candidimonas humi]MBV6303638.1 efflux RND transporter periplasmic adaptor subunit [Candidimonas humi]